MALSDAFIMHSACLAPDPLCRNHVPFLAVFIAISTDLLPGNCFSSRSFTGRSELAPTGRFRMRLESWCQTGKFTTLNGDQN